MIPIHCLCANVLLSVYNVLLIGAMTTYLGIEDVIDLKASIVAVLLSVLMVLEAVSIALDIRYVVVYWFMYHLLPFITVESLDQVQMDNLDDGKVNDCVFKLIWDRSDKMLDDIKTLKEVIILRLCGNIYFVKMPNVH